MDTRTFSIVPRGAFSLRESAIFGFGQRDGAARYDGIMRLAFCLDGSFDQHVAVELQQDDSAVHAVVHGGGDLTAIERQVARVLSLDHDARGFELIGAVDPVIASLQNIAPGLRPPLFYSPYEAAVWSVLSARRPPRQMAVIRARLSERHGTMFDLSGQRVAALPTPRQLLAIDAFPGIDEQRLERLHAVARAALDGLLESARLLAMGPDEAMSEVSKLKGIGPFYSRLIVVRGTGFVDVLPVDEPRVLDLARQLYGFIAPPNQNQFERIAQAWRPWRTWCVVLVRAAGPRLIEANMAETETPSARSRTLMTALMCTNSVQLG